MIKIKDVVDIDKFIEEEYKSNEGVYLFAFYDVKSKGIVQVPFVADLISVRRQMSRIDYIAERPKNEIYLFPKEFSLICLGRYDKDYNYHELKYSFGTIFDLLDANQKMQYVSTIENPLMNKEMVSLTSQEKK